MQDFLIADMGMNILRVIRTVGTFNANKLSIKCMGRNFLFVHFTTQLKNLILLVALVTFGFEEF